MIILTEQQEEIMKGVHEVNRLSVMITENLMQSMQEWDIVPPLISSVVWQTRQEIAKTWIETHSPEEWHQLIQPTMTNPLLLTYVAEQASYMVDEVGLAVQKILRKGVTLGQRITSRRWLHTWDAVSLKREDQDRVIASHLAISYRDWCALYNLLCSDENLLNFFRERDVSIGYSDDLLSLSRRVRKWWELLRLGDATPRTLNNTETDFISRKNGVPHIDFRGGINQCISFDSATLKNALAYINTPEQEKVVREIIFSKYSVPVWKNTSGRGNAPKKDKEPTWEFAWQK